MVDLGFGLPTREVRGDPAIAAECAPDGYPYTFNFETPVSEVATRVCAGNWNWWLVCKTIWGSDFAAPPPEIVIESLGAYAGLYLVTGPGGRMVVREVPAASAAEPRRFVDWRLPKRRC